MRKVLIDGVVVFCLVAAGLLAIFLCFGLAQEGDPPGPGQQLAQQLIGGVQDVQDGLAQDLTGEQVVEVAYVALSTLVDDLFVDLYDDIYPDMPPGLDPPPAADLPDIETAILDNSLNLISLAADMRPAIDDLRDALDGVDELEDDPNATSMVELIEAMGPSAEDTFWIYDYLEDEYVECDWEGAKSFITAELMLAEMFLDGKSDQAQEMEEWAASSLQRLQDWDDAQQGDEPAGDPTDLRTAAQHAHQGIIEADAAMDGLRAPILGDFGFHFGNAAIAAGKVLDTLEWTP